MLPTNVILIPERWRKRSTCPQNVRLRWSKERIRFGGGGNALPMPERERETGGRYMRVEGRNRGRNAHVCVCVCVCVCLGVRAFIGEKGKVGKYRMGKDSR